VSLFSSSVFENRRKKKNHLNSNKKTRSRGEIIKRSQKKRTAERQRARERKERICFNMKTKVELWFLLVVLFFYILEKDIN